MVGSSPLPPAIGVEDFAFHSQQPEFRFPHSEEQPFSSSPATPLDTAPIEESQDYSFTSNIYDDYSASRSTSDHEDNYTEEESYGNLRAPVAATSTRSSISSFPGSVLPETVPSTVLRDIFTTPTKSPLLHSHPEILHHGRSGSLSYKIKSPTARLRDSEHNHSHVRDYNSGFRNPSSVRAMQMRDEEPLESDPDKIARHRRHGSRSSAFSYRSTNSSPTKRNSRSSQSSPQKIGACSPSKLKKEFPLVLLHCSLLPPTLALNMFVRNETLLKEVLPDEYWRRWKVLQDKVGEGHEVRTRGVLIPHPREEYDALEERLLESLELERPRVRAGHFMGEGADADSGVGTESERDTESETEVDGQHGREIRKGTKCPDCGKRVVQDIEIDKKWEVKVYAANGLMRAGAWGAAWGDMEKVDIEVSVWMPEPVRREVEGKLRDLGVFGDNQIQHDEEAVFEETEEELRQREIYGSPKSVRQEDLDGLFDESMDATRFHSERERHNSQQPNKMDLPTLVIRYLKGMAQDKRNILIACLSILVMLLAISKPGATQVARIAPASTPVSQKIAATTDPLTALTTTAIATTTVAATSNLSESVVSRAPSASTSTPLEEITAPSAHAKEQDETTMIQQLGEMLADDEIVE